MINVNRIRFVCREHKRVLENVGSGRVVFPTDGNPIPDKDGWMELDTSEFGCPVGQECSDHWETEADDGAILDLTDAI